jgi:hypothetical protein
LVFVFVVLLQQQSMECARCDHDRRVQHKLSFYLHDTSSYRNASSNSATVEVPASPDMSKVATQFGKMYVFDDELTSELAAPANGGGDGHELEELKASAADVVGRAQGMYVYCGREEMSALWSFTAFLRDDVLDLHPISHRHTRSTTTMFYNSSLSFHGVERVVTGANNPKSKQLRPIAVVGGSGRFLDARGIAYVSTVASYIPNYFVLRFDVTFSTPT